MIPDLDSDILRLLEAKKTKDAIKLIRQRKKIGFAEAKALVDALREHQKVYRAPETPHARDHTFAPESHALRTTGLAPGEVPAPKNPVVNAVIVLMIFIAGLWYLFARG